MGHCTARKKEWEYFLLIWKEPPTNRLLSEKSKKPRNVYNPIQFKKDKQCQPPTLYVNVYVWECVILCLHMVYEQE